MQDNLAYKYEIPEECINGEVVTMSPRPLISHNFISGNVYSIFNTYLRHKSCTPFADGTDLHLSEKDIFVPDMMVVCDKDKIGRDGVYGAPALVVEVLSYSTATRDRGYKMRAYEAAGVKEYWIINPTDFSVEVYLLEDGRFQLKQVYTLYRAEDLELLTEEEKAALPESFRCSLFPDLEIKLEDVFWRLF